jgi:hypothetical protein
MISSLLSSLMIFVPVSAGKGNERQGSEPLVDLVEFETHKGSRTGFYLRHDPKQPGHMLISPEGEFVQVPEDAVKAELQRRQVPVTDVPSAVLVRGLSHEHGSIRSLCQRWLFDQGKAAIPALPAGLKAELAEAVRRTLEVIIRTPQRSLAGGVKKCLRHSNTGVRARAVDAYFTIRPDMALDVGGSMLSSEQDNWVRHRLLLALGNSSSEEAVPVILEYATEDWPEPVQRAAFAALRKLTAQTYTKVRHWKAWWRLQRQEREGPPRGR